MAKEKMKTAANKSGQCIGAPSLLSITKAVLKKTGTTLTRKFSGRAHIGAEEIRSYSR